MVHYFLHPCSGCHLCWRGVSCPEVLFKPVSAISGSSSGHWIPKPLFASAWPFLALRQKYTRGYFLRKQIESCHPQVLRSSFDSLWVLHEVHILDLVEKGLHTLTPFPSCSYVLDTLRCSNSSKKSFCLIIPLSSHSLLLLPGMLFLAF